jgi:hypothetical protein
MTKNYAAESFLLIVLKEMFNFFKVLFQSNSNKEFKQLKNFISA